MSESIPPIPADQQTLKPHRRRFLDEFKRDAVRLITDQQYTFQAAALAVGVSQNSLLDWHRKFAAGANRRSSWSANESCAEVHAARLIRCLSRRHVCSDNR